MNRSLLLLAVLIIFYSCSPSQQIQRSAKRGILQSEPMQTAHIGISIFDPSTNKYLYNYQGDKYFVPASNIKIPTCYAAMKYLGDSLVGLRYQYQDHLNKFNILPTGDPTFLHPDFKEQRALEFYKENRDKKFDFDITKSWNEYPWGSGWSWNDYEAGYMAERSPLPIYGNTVRFKKQGEIFVKEDDSSKLIVTGLEVYPKYFAKFLEGYTPELKTNDNIKINRNLSSNIFTARYSSSKFSVADMPFVTNREQTFLRLLDDTIGLEWSYALGDSPLSEDVTFHAGMVSYGRDKKWSKDLLLDRSHYKTIHSQPTDYLLKPMMHRSDNFFAEQALLMASNEFLGVMSDNKIIDTLLKTHFKDLPQKPRWVDGSGLSRYNLFTPQDFIAILNQMKNEFGMERIQAIFPTGNEGTLTNYYKELNGKLFAKTGTLSGVVALSGYMYTKKNKLLLFSVLVNNHQSTSTNVRRAVEHFLTGIQANY